MCSNFAEYSRYRKLYFFPLCSDIAIARSQEPKDVSKLAEEIGLIPKEVNLYGTKKAKISLKSLDRLKNKRDGKYVVVSG